MDNAAWMETWLRTKYTNRQLYGWLNTHLRMLYAHAHALTVAAARRAKIAPAIEKGRYIEILPQGGSCYWDASRDGLLVGDYFPRLRDYEDGITTRINPMTLLRLRLMGNAAFSLGEILYDADYPGHYIRRIRGIAISIPAVVGPYTGANATLTLLRHKYDRSDFRTDYVPITTATISLGSHDSGMFEFTFSGPRYMPFEGAGAISTWRLDRPIEVRRFDYETISDVVMHVGYTASNGSGCLQAAANVESRRCIPSTSTT
ncbi:hypothetical protein F4782DRAFT_544998 [Xylaria castorea]|nr:hypothetical protein F4782DRAFT_544998 [Xylaria castorea]